MKSDVSLSLETTDGRIAKPVRITPCLDPISSAEFPGVVDLVSQLSSIACVCRMH
jgi:hypothetical protein